MNTMLMNSQNSVARENYINREMSWLEFNQRVLDQAVDPNVPLLERLKFLAITCNNLDEFFMVRVGDFSSSARQAPCRAIRRGFPSPNN